MKYSFTGGRGFQGQSDVEASHLETSDADMQERSRPNLSTCNIKTVGNSAAQLLLRGDIRML